MWTIKSGGMTQTRATFPACALVHTLHISKQTPLFLSTLLSSPDTILQLATGLWVEHDWMLNSSCQSGGVIVVNLANNESLPQLSTKAPIRTSGAYRCTQVPLVFCNANSEFTSISQFDGVDVRFHSLIDTHSCTKAFTAETLA